MTSFWLFLQIAAILLVFLALVSVIVSSLRLGISPMPSSGKAIEAMLSALPSELEGTIVELGCGWGGVLLALARRFPECTVVGYERSPVPWLLCRLRLFWRRPPNLRLHYLDFFDAPLHEARAVVCYLFPGAMKRLAPKLQEELPPGAFVLSNTFALPHWTPHQHRTLGDLYSTPIYIYRLPESAPSPPS